MSPSTPIPTSLAALLAALVFPGCLSAGGYEAQADRAAADVFSEGRYTSLADRPSTAVYPETIPRDEPGAEVEAGEVAAAEPQKRRVLTLREALDISIQSGRDYLTQKEGLYLSALSLTGTRRLYSPILSAVLSQTFADGAGLPAVHSSDATAGVSQLLPWGADVNLGLTGGLADTELTDSVASAGASIRYTQPLLRGGGRAVTHESLIQAERTLMYAIRDFERFRESYAIDVTQRYYDLVESKQSLENQARSLDQLEFGRRQSEAKFSLGEIQEVQVLLARRAELTAENELLQAEAGLELELDQFRVFLGLPDTVRIDVVPEVPEFIAVDYDVESAIQAALQNRLDYLTEKEQVEDTDRRLAIAANSLRPSLDFTAGYGVTDIEGAPNDLSDWNAGLTLTLPVDRINERNAYRSAQITRVQAIRAFEAFEDNLVVNLRNRFRSLRRIELSLEIQRERIHDEERNLVIARILFERGDNKNRDVVEAQQTLLLAQNALVNEQVNYEIERLNLLRDMGILFIDENGMWTE